MGESDAANRPPISFARGGYRLAEDNKANPRGVWLGSLASALSDLLSYLPLTLYCTMKYDIDHLLRTQEGVITRAQALRAGYSARSIDWRLKSGEWIRLLPRTYRLGIVAPSWRQQVIGTWLWAGNGAAISHRSAAVLLRLAGAREGDVELSIPSQRPSPEPRILLYKRTIPAQDLARVGCLTVTRPTRTLVDLASVIEEDALEWAIDDAIRRGLTSVSKLDGCLSALGTKGKHGPAVVRQLLQSRDPHSAPSESLLEVKAIRVIKAAGFPAPHRQFPIKDGRVRRRLDLAYVVERIVIECDGFEFHSGKIAFQNDRDRQNFLTSSGWRVLRFTWDDVRDPSRFIAHLRNLLSLSIRAVP